jgi:hypothetical protein
MKLPLTLTLFKDSDFKKERWHRFDLAIEMESMGLKLYRLPDPDLGYTKRRLYPLFGIANAGSITIWKKDTKIKIYSTVIHDIKKISRLSKTITSSCCIATLRNKVDKMA